jgi:putative nucleotidyltransferase with HDIG domain
VQKTPSTLKKISVEQLRLGMFINELCGSWMDHPFWQTKFKLTDPADLATLHETAITEVWIDTAKGLDVEDATAEERETLEETYARFEQTIVAAIAAEKPRARSLQAEVTRAAEVCGQARAAVTEMFAEARMGKAFNASKLEPLVDEISSSVERNPGALISLARLKTQDDYTYMHSVAVCGLMTGLARQLGLEPDLVHEAGLAGLLHDVGKAKVSLDILNKPGKLTAVEFEQMKSHPARGHALLLESGTAGEVALDVCLHHHEKVDGTGYPEKLNGEQLSLFSKMGAVCDVYDAITSNRPYKAGWDPSLAIRKMYEWCDGHFDAAIFQAFVKTVGIYPVGSLVRLDSGLLAVVSEATPDNLLKPRVKTVYCTQRKNFVNSEDVDLSDFEAGARIVSWEDPADWPLGDLRRYWAPALEAEVSDLKTG